MKNALMMDFTVDKANSTVNIKREFAAPLELVWKAWTDKDLTDKWWAPKPWQSKTKFMDFREGGTRLYAMVGPNGEEHWAKADYLSITEKAQFKALDAFCDSEGNINENFPRSNWVVDFEPAGEKTLVHIAIKHEKLEDLEQIIAMGFKEGMTIAMEGLDEILAA